MKVVTTATLGRYQRRTTAVAAAAEPSSSTRRALLIVYVGYIARYLFPLLLIPYFARVLGAGEYGKVTAALSLVNVVWLVVQYGFPLIGAREVAGGAHPGRVASLFGSHIAARLLLCIVGCAIGALGTILSPALNADPRFGVVATVLGILAAFNVAWYFQGVGQFRTQLVVEIMAFTANLVLMFALVRDSTDGFTAMLVFLATGAASTLAAYVVVIRQIGVRRIRLSGALQVLKASTAIFASSGIAAVITNSSALLLSLFASSAAVAFFTVAERVTNLGLGLMVPANQVLLPAVSRHLSAPDGAGGAFLLMRRACGVMAVFGVLACMAMIFLSPYLIPLIFGEDYKQSIVIAQLFGLSYPFAALNQVIAMYVLIPMRRENLVAKITIGGALCNLVAIFLLAPHFSGLGMAAARLISEVFVLAMFFVVLRSSGTLDSLLLMRTKKPGLN